MLTFCGHFLWNFKIDFQKNFSNFVTFNFQGVIGITFKKIFRLINKIQNATK